MRHLLRLPTLLGLLLVACTAIADGTPKANWKLADRFNSDYLRLFVASANVTPGWINKTDTFWYAWRDQSGTKYYRVDPKALKKALLFDSDKMAALLSELRKRPYDATNLPITTVTFDE